MPLSQISSKTHSLQKGEALFRQGETAAAIYWVEKGCIRLERRTFDGRLVLIHTALAGEFLAEASLFSDIYHCDAIASEPSLVWAYPHAAVLQMLQSEPATATSFLATVARQLQRTRQRLELRNVRSAKERLILYLQLQADEGGQVTLKGELQDLAAELGLSREAVYRTLADLERTGHIWRSGGTILIRKSLDV
jgi:CRP-like cAMP-binding protein